MLFSLFRLSVKKVPIKELSAVPYGIAPHIAHSQEFEVSHRLQELSAS